MADQILKDSKEHAIGKTSAVKQNLPRNIAPLIVGGIGALFVLIAMFLPTLSSRTVNSIANNMMIQQHPVILLCSLGALVAIFRFWSTGSKGAANGVIFNGIVFLLWTIYDAYSSQLYLYGSVPVDTAAGPGLWTAGVGCAIVLIGGLMIRFPQLNIIGTASITASEQNIIETSTKICPKCAETIKTAALVCRFCNYQYEENK